ncbi:MAG TPA: M18 family aminopeptidase, partial [bacterium]|nr:M18 family aminopeptidase [bacterium]
MNSEIKKLGSALIDFLDSSPTAFHATENIEKRLKKEGFSELDESEPWKILPGEKYFVKRNSSSILAFIAGKEKPVKTGFRIAGAHTDSPLLKIKDN